MASNISSNISSSGYDVQVVGETKLNCGICLMIIKNATNGCTKHVFCNACILKHIECGTRVNGKVICPGGCRINIKPKKLVLNEFVDRLVNCLPTKCSNDHCNWQGDLLDLVQVHQTNCDYALQSCNIKGCNKKYFKKDILKHDEDCLFKLIECTYCHTDILRMNMEAHVVECLNEQVKCIYYDIGCKNKFCRRDICSHEETHQAKHMRLIYQELVMSKNEVIFLKKENTGMREESALMKQENESLKKKLIDLETKSTQLALEVKTLTKDLKESKQGNLKLIGKKRKLESNAANEMIVARNKAVGMKSNDDVNNIDSLKQRLCLISSLREKVSLVNDDKVMVIKGNMFIYTKDLSKCYQDNDFKYVLDKSDLNDHKSLMTELLNKVSYHLYDFKCDGKQLYKLVFPLDLQNIKDVEVLIPGLFRMKILNNEAMVEILNQRINRSVFCNEKYQKELKPGEKYNLKQLSGWQLINCSFPHGYAFLYLE